MSTKMQLRGKPDRRIVNPRASDADEKILARHAVAFGGA
jgi:hypothetical protein